MAKEIERKFLLANGTNIPIPVNHMNLKIKQAYLCGEKGKQIRVRIINNFKAWLTVKYTTSQIRDEFEYLIPLEDAKVMFKKSLLKLEKKRLAFDSQEMRGVHYDIDSFPNGMQWIEVEFDSIKTMKRWEKQIPNWIGDEITKVRKYSNITLAKKNLKFS